MSAALAAVLYRWRLPLTAVVLVGAAVLSPRADITRIDNDITAWFSVEDPVYRDYERFRREFGGTRTLIVAVEGERIFTREGLRFLQTVSGAIERVPTVERVFSLANANLVDTLPASGDEPGGLEVRPLLDRLGERDPAVVRARALADPLIRGDLVSTDGTVTSIIVTFDEDRIDEVRAGVIQQIRDIVDPALPAGLRAHYNGSLEISETYNRITLENQQQFTPPIVLVTVLALYAMFRSLRKTVIVLVGIGASVFWTLGIYSLLGFTFNVLTSMIVPLIIVLAISDDVHILQHYDHELRAHGDRRRAFTGTITHLFRPLFAASGTTALGLLSLATSDVVAVRTFGVGAAVGVMMDLVVSIVYLPTVLGLVRIDPAPAPQERYLLGPMRAVGRFSAARPWLVVALSTAVAVTAIAGMLRLRVDTNHINFFSRRHPLHQSADVIDRQLSGVYSFQILLEGPPDAFKDPETLRRLDRLERQIERMPFVRKVTSVADYVKRVHQKLNDDRPEAAAVPDTRELVAQELFVFSLSDEGRRELDRIVASDFSRAQVSVKLASMSSDLVFAQIEQAERAATEAFAGTPISALATGSGRLFSQLDRYLVQSQLSSFGTAFVTVFGVIFLVFRSLRYGALAIVPNLFPVLAVLGAMGWLGISLNVATVMLASVALGVVDDDTIHFINRYRHETGAGASTDAAIEAATMYEGRAALTTALINSCGFGVLLLSEYKPTAWFGGLLGLTMAVAFLAEVFVLPASIKLAPRLFGAPGRPAAAAAAERSPRAARVGWVERP